MIGTQKQGEMVKFYEMVIGKSPDMHEANWSGWTVGSCFLGIGEHSEMHGNSKDAGRIMFNFETKDVKEEFERIKNEGATVIKEPYEMGSAWIATLADPDGNYFQLMSPWDEK